MNGTIAQRCKHPGRRAIGAAIAGAFLVTGIVIIRTTPPSFALAGTDAMSLWDIGFWMTFLASAALGCFLFQAFLSKLRPAAWRGRGQSGSAMVEMLVIIIPLYMMFAILIQLSMIAHTSLVLRHAAFAAARAAMVDSERDSDQPLATEAACLTLATIAPAAKKADPVGSRAQKILERQSRPWYDPQFSGKVTFARAATVVETDPQPISGGPTDVTVHLSYKFRLGVPGGRLIFPCKPATIAGVSGYFMDLHAGCKLTSTGSLKGSAWKSILPP